MYRVVDKSSALDTNYRIMDYMYWRREGERRKKADERKKKEKVRESKEKFIINVYMLNLL